MPSPVAPLAPIQRLSSTPTASPNVGPGQPAEGGPDEAHQVPLAVFWANLRQLGFVPLLDHLQPLPADRRDDPFFGVADALTAGDAGAPIMRGVGASRDRLELRWDALEPAPNVYDFSQIDATLATGRRLHFSVLAVIDGTPAWAAGAGGAGQSPPTGLGEPALLPDGKPNPANPWACFLATLAARYGQQIGAWEIWNEPNSTQFWTGTPAQYARLLAIAQAILGHSSPAAPVLTGGMVSDDGAYLRSVAATLCPSFVCPGGVLQAVAWHVYDNPADVTRLAALTRSILQPYGIQPQIWITEANVPVDDPAAPADAVVGPDAVSLTRQAAFVWQIDTLARASDVTAVFIYRAADVDDRGHYWGLIRSDWTARPALLAYREAAQWLSHAQLQQFSTPKPGLTLAGFCRPDATVYVAWNNSDHPAILPIPATAAHADLVGATGTATPLAAAGGDWLLNLPAAAPATPFTVPLGEPHVLVVTGKCA